MPQGSAARHGAWVPCREELIDTCGASCKMTSFEGVPTDKEACLFVHLGDVLPDVLSLAEVVLLKQKTVERGLIS